MLELSNPYVIAFLLFYINVTAIIDSIYNHRGLAHRTVSYNRVLEFVFKMVLWVGPGISNATRVAIHRHHHKASDTIADPHSPRKYGLLKSMFLYTIVVTVKYVGFLKFNDVSPEYIKKYNATRDPDFMTDHPRIGRFVFLLISVILFSWHGIILFFLYYLSVALTGVAAGIVLIHYVGYRNFSTPDFSSNLFPIGLIFGGEELHNNHHKFPNSPKFSIKKFEFDLGWEIINILQKFNLATIKPEILKNFNEQRIDKGK